MSEETEKLETCLFIKKGIECTIALGQHQLQEHLFGNYKVEGKDIANMHILKIAMPTLKRFCKGVINESNLELYERDIDSILGDMEDYAK